MQENTPSTPAQGKIKEIKGVEIEISKPKKVIRLNADMWGSLKVLEYAGIAGPGDLLILLGVMRLNDDNDTYAIIVKAVNVNGKVNTDNGKE
jgi:hypothetical protein